MATLGQAVAFTLNVSRSLDILNIMSLSHMRLVIVWWKSFYFIVKTYYPPLYDSTVFVTSSRLLVVVCDVFVFVYHCFS